MSGIGNSDIEKLARRFLEKFWRPGSVGTRASGKETMMTEHDPYIPAAYDADCAPGKGTYEYYLLAGNPVRVWIDPEGNRRSAEKLDRENPGSMKLANVLLSRLSASDEVEPHIGKARFVEECKRLEQEHRRSDLKKPGSAETPNNG